MPAPTVTDGASRAVEELVAPSTLAILLVVGTYYYYGPRIAGAVLVGLTLLGMLVVASKAKYWNTQYTLGFLAFSLFVLFSIPTVLGEFVHPVFDIIGDILVFTVLLIIGSFLASKLD